MSQSLHHIDLKAGGAIGMPEPVTNQATRDYYYVSSLMNEAITSSQLEGAAVTRDVAREMLQSDRKPRDRGEQMILNNYRTMQRLESLKDKPLTPDIVFEIHRSITQDALDDPTAVGRFRKADEHVEVVDSRTEETLHVPPSAEELPQRLQLLCDFANESSPEPVFVHPVIRAIILHFILAYDHPFVDGNGRTARALFYWMVLRKNYWLFQFISISEMLLLAPVQYGRSYLLTETDEDDLNYFILHQLQTIEKALEALHHFIERKARELKETGTLLRLVAHQLNHRQEAILSRALREPSARFSIQAHAHMNRIAYATARADLLGLEELGLFLKHTRGKGYEFVPVDELRAQVQRLGQ